jgi:hypothetical protein
MESRENFRNNCQENWEYIYLLTDEWISDMECYNNELRFITNAINKNFLWLTRNGNIDSVQKNIEKIERASKQYKEIAIKLNNHLVRIEEFMMNPFLSDDEEFRNEHSKLADQFYAFEKKIKKIKQETYLNTKNTIKEEDLSYRLAF